MTTSQHTASISSQLALNIKTAYAYKNERSRYLLQPDSTCTCKRCLCCLLYLHCRHCRLSGWVAIAPVDYNEEGPTTTCTDTTDAGQWLQLWLGQSRCWMCDCRQKQFPYAANATHQLDGEISRIKQCRRKNRCWPGGKGIVFIYGSQV